MTAKRSAGATILLRWISDARQAVHAQPASRLRHGVRSQPCHVRPKRRSDRNSRVIADGLPASPPAHAPPLAPAAPLIMFTYLFITKYIVSFFSCIIVPNALRDIFMPGKPLFPDDAKMYAYMSLKPPMDSFLWNGWGTWALTIVAMKVVAVWTAAAPFIALGAFSDIAFVAIAAKHRVAIKKATEGEMAPFMVIFGVSGAAGLISLL